MSVQQNREPRKVFPIKGIRVLFFGLRAFSTIWSPTTPSSHSPPTLDGGKVVRATGVELFNTCQVVFSLCHIHFRRHDEDETRAGCFIPNHLNAKWVRISNWRWLSKGNNVCLLTSITKRKRERETANDCTDGNDGSESWVLIWRSVNVYFPVEADRQRGTFRLSCIERLIWNFSGKRGKVFFSNRKKCFFFLLKF